MTKKRDDSPSYTTSTKIRLFINQRLRSVVLMSIIFTIGICWIFWFVTQLSNRNRAEHSMNEHLQNFSTGLIQYKSSISSGTELSQLYNNIASFIKTNTFYQGGDLQIVLDSLKLHLMQLYEAKDLSVNFKDEAVFTSNFIIRQSQNIASSSDGQILLTVRQEALNFINSFGKIKSIFESYLIVDSSSLQKAQGIVSALYQRQYEEDKTMNPKVDLLHRQVKRAVETLSGSITEYTQTMYKVNSREDAVKGDIATISLLCRDNEQNFLKKNSAFLAWLGCGIFILFCFALYDFITIKTIFVLPTLSGTLKEDMRQEQTIASQASDLIQEQTTSLPINVEQTVASVKTISLVAHQLQQQLYKVSNSLLFNPTNTGHDAHEYEKDSNTVSINQHSYAEESPVFQQALRYSQEIVHQIDYLKEALNQYSILMLNETVEQQVTEETTVFSTTNPGAEKVL